MKVNGRVCLGLVEGKSLVIKGRAAPPVLLFGQEGLQLLPTRLTRQINKRPFGLGKRQSHAQLTATHGP